MSIASNNLELINSEVQGKNTKEITNIIKKYYPQVAVMVQEKFDYHCEEQSLIEILEDNAVRVNRTNTGFYFSYVEKDILKGSLIDETIPYVFVTTKDEQTEICECVLEYYNDGMPKKN